MVKWEKNKVIFNMPRGDSFMVDGYVVFYNKGTPRNDGFYMKHLGETLELITEFELGYGHAVMISGVFYNYEEGIIPPAEDIYSSKEEDDPSGNSDEFIEFENGTLYIVSKYGEKVDSVVEFYTNETYPDYPIFEKKFSFKSIGKNKLMEVENGYIVKVYVKCGDSETFFEEFETRPAVYFSNVKALKEDIDELGIKCKEKTDEAYKKLIAEKSLYAKTRYGLLYEHTIDRELMPLLKALVNLLCIKELVSLYFIQGEDPSGENPVTYRNRNLTLGKFNSGSDGNNYTIDSVYSIETLDYMIKHSEVELEKALFKPSTNIKVTKPMGVIEHVYSFGKVSKCFKNW